MEEPLVDGVGAFNGLELLDCCDVLRERLSAWKLAGHLERNEDFIDVSSVPAELSLLVHGILDDGEMFKRFGPRYSHEQGQLRAVQWIAAQNADSNKWITIAQQMPQFFDDIFDDVGLLYQDVSEFGRAAALCHSWEDSGQDWVQADFETENRRALRDLEETLAGLPPQLADCVEKPERYVVTTDNQVLGGHTQLRNSILELQRQDLVSKYKSPEAFLLKEVRDGNVSLVRALLQHARDGSQVGPSIPAEVLDLDRVLEGTTALIEAVRGGYLRIAKMLIQHGADVNIMTASRETAVTVAAKAGSDAMLRLLLAYGADAHIAVLMLRVDRSAGSGASAINRLTASVTRYRKDMLLHTRKIPTEVVRLRREFHDEHCRMIQCSSTGPGTSEMRRYGLEGGSRKAWCIARRTLRGLCNGTLPSSLNETLLFIALSKVMSSIVHGKDDAGAATELNQDLGRWQLLFNLEDGGLDAFRSAVMVFWGIDTSTLDATPSASEDVLAAFQDMALSCFSRASELLETEGLDELGLISIQNRWRERQQEGIRPPEAKVHDSSYLLGKEGQSEDDGSGLQEAIVERLEFDILLDPPKPPPPLCDEPTPYQRLFVLLIAGAIFAAAIAFLLCMFDSPDLSFLWDAADRRDSADFDSKSLVIRERPTPSNSPSDSPSDSPYAGPPVERPIKHLFKSRPTRPTGKRARVSPVPEPHPEPHPSTPSVN